MVVYNIVKYFYQFRGTSSRQIFKNINITVIKNKINKINIKLLHFLVIPLTLFIKFIMRLKCFLKQIIIAFGLVFAEFYKWFVVEQD